MKRRLVVTLVFLLAVGLCGAGLVQLLPRQDDRELLRHDAAAGPDRVGHEARAITWTLGISAIGTARAEKGVELAVEIGGVVQEIRSRPTSASTRATCWSSSTTSIERADLVDAQAAVKLSEANLERSTTLRQRGFDTRPPMTR